jgi:YbgC/YbaW family acyl-CoA thioester hydrolase
LRNIYPDMRTEYNEADYSYITPYRVRSHECDRQGVVHNSRYLEILEVARIEFCRDILKIPMDTETFASHHKFFFVRNAVNYFSPAEFDEELVIYTRVPKIGKTSVMIQQIMNRKSDDSRILECESVMVSVDEKTNEPKEIDEELRKQITGAK